MAATIKSLLFFTLLAQACCVEIFILEEETVNYVVNDHIGHSITIPKFLFDTLKSCHIIFPNGVTYEAYPSSNIPKDTIFFLGGVDIFRACAVGFRGIGLEDAGTYELVSMVPHQRDNNVSMTRQKFKFVAMEREDWKLPEKKNM